ncbi:hypothetical protein [Lutibacter flavus]|uniref:Lipoprotein n=1 Tax=Lutibacter flavus TaxID=691689 RepID=A0A238VUH4_9FLAO|nr:hypothetical protein [Lutibacter flavus]SNR37831.1 hypothetical protein SAMN04488111_1043 [Lutibacter flavus]
MNKKLFKYVLIISIFNILFFTSSCNEKKTDLKNKGVEHSELMTDFGMIKPDGEYIELFLTKNKIYEFNDFMGLIQPHEYKYLNDSLIQFRYGNYAENKYYNVNIEQLDDGTIKCTHIIPKEFVSDNPEKTTNIEFLFPIDKDETTISDYFDIDTGKIDKKIHSELHQHFRVRERKNVP